MIDIFLSSSGDLSRTPSPRLDYSAASSPSSRSLTPLTPVDSNEHLCTELLLFCGRQGLQEHNSGVVKSSIPTPTPTPPITSAQDDYLQLLEPIPIAPPGYNSLPPGGCPRFPVYMDHSGPQRLPLYTPTAYKIGLVGRKQEWLTPYEPLTSRLWKTVIMELNLTQINFYSIPSLLEAKTLQTFHRIRLSCSGMNSETDRGANSHSPLALSLTFPVDTLFHDFCSREGIINGSLTLLTGATSRNLIRSYTLQHARIGLASDYRKRSNVLRIRAESEQFLVDFGDVQDLIDWNMALGVGRDVALDIQEREMPIYRTVPRRRRRRRQTTLGVLEMPSRELWTDFGRQRLLLDLKIRGRLGRIRLKLLLGGAHVSLLPPGLLSGVFERTPTDSEPYIGAIGRYPGDNSTERTSLRAAIFNVGAPDEADIGRSVLDLVPYDRHGLDLTPFESGADEDDLATNVEDPDDDDLDEYDPEMREERTHCTWNDNADDIKWDPLASTLVSIQKYYRTCLRCIKPLTAEELWVGKVLVKPTTILPLSFWYLRNVKYGEIDSSLTSLASLSSNNRRRGLMALRELPHMDLSLPKVPNHFVKEYTVGTHGLVPKYL